MRKHSIPTTRCRLTPRLYTLTDGGRRSPPEGLCFDTSPYLQQTFVLAERNRVTMVLSGYSKGRFQDRCPRPSPIPSPPGGVSDVTKLEAERCEIRVYIHHLELPSTIEPTPEMIWLFCLVARWSCMPRGGAAPLVTL